MTVVAAPGLKERAQAVSHSSVRPRLGFNLAQYLSTINLKMLETTDARRALTFLDPLAFALLYLPHHLKGDATLGRVTLNEFHLALIEQAKEWALPLGSMREFRDAYVAPRECGKSTWLFTILPLWAAAQGHMRFIAAFADSASQAEQHLATFRHELDTNELLNLDFPELCEPGKRTRVARQLADNRGQIQQANGFIFMARGVDSATLGMKVGALRPQLIILDDIEPGESQYSSYQVEKRLRTLQDVILPLNNFARVVLSGTVTMAGSIIHQLVQSVTSSEEPEGWIREEDFDVHYFPAILEDEHGEERSIWPDKWPLSTLQAMRGSRSFEKNFQNQPLEDTGVFWSREDFTFGKPESYGPTILSVDPAVTSRQTSDYTGFAVLSRSVDRSRKEVYVRHASHARKSPADIRLHVLEVLSAYPDITHILIETNQGGDAWTEILHDVPVKVKTIHQREAKEIRAQRALNHYQRGHVFHTKRLSLLEEEMLAFPNGANDDMVDAVSTGVCFFLEDRKPRKAPSKRQVSYV